MDTNLNLKLGYVVQATDGWNNLDRELSYSKAYSITPGKEYIIIGLHTDDDNRQMFNVANDKHTIESFAVDSFYDYFKIVLDQSIEVGDLVEATGAFSDIKGLAHGSITPGQKYVVVEADNCTSLFRIYNDYGRLVICLPWTRHKKFRHSPRILFRKV